MGLNVYEMRTRNRVCSNEAEQTLAGLQRLDEHDRDVGPWLDSLDNSNTTVLPLACFKHSLLNFMLPKLLPCIDRGIRRLQQVFTKHGCNAWAGTFNLPGVETVKSRDTWERKAPDRRHGPCCCNCSLLMQPHRLSIDRLLSRCPITA